MHLWTNGKLMETFAVNVIQKEQVNIIQVNTLGQIDQTILNDLEEITAVCYIYDG